ncbi:MAG: adenylyl cyclase, partial [Pseudomonadota bacterium]
MKQLLAELNRRNVIRMAIAYGVTCWLMLQVADIGLQAIAAPDWVMRAFVLAFVVGLPFVLIFSWVYELTPDGLKREAHVEPDASVTDVTARKLDYVVIGLLVFVLGIVVMRMVSQPTSAPAQTTADTRPAVNAEETSVAVLAFENMSADAEQGYFADGLSEELLNKLAQNPEIKVAGRTSSFAFKGQNRDLREIGEILNVAYILEGSVRKAGNQIRVTAQLVDAAEGFQLFSETYDGNLTDVFRVQDTIARQISQTLISQLTGTIDESDVTDPAAYELFLRARQDIVSRDTPRLQSASVMLDRVLDIDPEYAPALAQKALVVYLLSDASGAYGQVSVDVAVPEAQRFATQALELAPNLADEHAVN